MAPRLVRPSAATRAALAAAILIIVSGAVFLWSRYAALPDVLPVHFMRNGYPDGWQYKTYARVMMPVLVQLALLITLGGIATLLLSRSHADATTADDAPDVRAASAAAEAIALIALVWIAFQGYAAFALARMWQLERGGLGWLYTALEITGVTVTLVIFARANVKLGRPIPRPFVPEHWRFGQLYKNPADPALFVPTRDGRRWTLNFGRPIAAALMGIVLVLGIAGPALILRLLLR